MTRRPCLLGLLGALLGFGGCGDGPYHREGGRWLYDETEFTPLDPASFQPLDERFARDARRGYYRGFAVADSHGPSFQVISEHEARDQAAVYYADTYRKGQEYWAYRHVRIHTLTGADPASYRLRGQGYASDQAGAWFEGRPFRVRDLPSFEVLEDGWARDRERGYHEGVEVAASRGPQLRSLGRGYASDGQRVWFRGRWLNDAHAASFVVPESPASGSDAADQRGAWLYGRRAP